MLKVGEVKEIKVMLLDDNGNPTAGTITYAVYDENDASFTTGTMSAIAGVTGFYTMIFTPDAVGAWSVLLTCSDPNRTAVKMFDVGVGVEQASYDAIVVLSTALTTHDTDIKALLATIQTDLDSPIQYKADVSALALEASLITHDTNIQVLLTALNDLSAGDVWTHGTRTLTDPNSYKADVSALALEATLTSMKGVGWSSETLKAIYDAIAALNDIAVVDIWSAGSRTLTDPNSYKADVSALALEATLSTHDSDIKTNLEADLKWIKRADLDDPPASVIGSMAWVLTKIKAKTDNLPIDPADESLLEAEINANEAKIDTVDGVVDAILIDTSTTIPALIGSPAADLAADIAAIKTVVDAISGYVDTEVAAIKSQTDKIPRMVTHMDFKSLPLQVTLTATAGDRGLVDVVVSGLPANVTIIAVEGIFYCDTVENTFDGVNYLESTKIQVKEKTAGTDRDAITLEANKIFRFTAQMVRGGTVLTPDWATATAAGILAEVTGNATYQMWFDVGETKQNNIVLDGAVFMLRIWFSV